MIAEALDYTRRGLSVFPVRRNKKPAVTSWKRFQDARASEDQIRQWFEENAAEGVAVVCGAISGDLVVRDYDDEDAYHAWTVDHPDLARALPTAETGRIEWRGKAGSGFQVWVRSPSARFIDFDGAGELRNDKHYVVAPPSVHESGKRYQWIVPLTDPIPEVDLAGVGLLEGNRAIRSSCSVCSGSSDCSVPLPDAIAEAVRQTVPKIEGRRNKSIWRLVRELKGIPDLRGVPLGRFEPIVQSWHELAIPNIKTRDWDTTWADFIIAWDRCKHAKGSSHVETNILGNASSLPVPKCAKRYDTDPVRELVAEFRGLTGTAKQKQVLAETGLAKTPLTKLVVNGDFDHRQTASLLDSMKRHCKLVKPDFLGFIGKDNLAARFESAGCDMDSFTYDRQKGIDDGLPWVIETAFGYVPCDDASRRLVTGVNWSPGIGNPFRRLGRFGRSCDTLLAELKVQESDPVILLIHGVCPRVSYLDRGKSGVVLS